MGFLRSNKIRFALTLATLVAGGSVLAEDLPPGLLAPVVEWAGKVSKDSKNADGKPIKSVVYSKTPQKIDDSTYEVGAHVNTAEFDRQVTERYSLTIKKNAKGVWELAENKVVDTYVGLFRTVGVGCYPFESFSFDREGLQLSAKNGTMCESYREGKTTYFVVRSPNMTYKYAPPPHAAAIQTGHDFYAVHKILAKDHASQLSFTPESFSLSCDEQTCQELMNSSFTGLTRAPADQRGEPTLDPVSAPDWIKPFTDETKKERKEDPFAHFRARTPAGNRFYRAYVAQRLTPEKSYGVFLDYDNWAEWEVSFSVDPERFDVDDQLAGSIYGYFTEETLKKSDAYAIEHRDGEEARWFQVESVKGRVDLALEDPETITGDVEFGLKLQQETQELPFAVFGLPKQGVTGKEKPGTLSVNSVQIDGKEVTWVRSSPLSGWIILPEKLPAGSTVVLRMNFASKGLYKLNYSYSFVSRFGWIPFARFGDFIDEFDLTIRSPAEYQIIGIGKKVSETVEGNVRVSHWTAGAPVDFPTIIFGRYRSDHPKIQAKKADGTPIPITVYLDEASVGDWDIHADALRPIADQAANAINLYTSISGLDYPFDQLSLVNDPLGFLYGQAPSSLIYLGNGVFRGEGSIAPFFQSPAGIATFLRSVVAHEVGHQWWGSRVANANGRNYWFVESLAEYFSAIFLEAVYGWKDYEQQVDEWRQNILRDNLMGNVQNASTLFSGGYQASVYSKGPYAFHMLREMFKGEGPRGPDGADKKFFDALKVWCQELAAKREIVTYDIQHSLEKAFGGVGPDGQPYKVDLGWFFDQWIRGAGIPEYKFMYEVREAEGGGYVIEGVIHQRVVVGNRMNPQVLPNTYYRGLLDITVKGKSGEFAKRMVVQGAETPFKLKVKDKPIDVALNKNGETLAHDVRVNRGW